MATVTGKTKRLDTPDGSGWVEIRALGFLALENAQKKRLNDVIEMAKALKDVPTPPSNGTEPDPLNSYDKLYLLKHGLTAWSYEGEVNVEELDKPTADWAAGEILEYSVPGETEVGKASSRSTVTLATPSITARQTNGS